jgi:hypothetical protein
MYILLSYLDYFILYFQNFFHSLFFIIPSRSQNLMKTILFYHFYFINLYIYSKKLFLFNQFNTFLLYLILVYYIAFIIKFLQLDNY